jgi:hypothetical protein
MTIKEALKELKEAQYIGEDGNMAVNTPTKRGAWIKFRQRWREDIGDHEAQELTEEYIGTAWLHLVSELPKDEQERFEDAEWYVDYRNPSPYEVWVYSF